MHIFVEYVVDTVEDGLHVLCITFELANRHSLRQIGVSPARWTHVAGSASAYPLAIVGIKWCTLLTIFSRRRNNKNFGTNHSFSGRRNPQKCIDEYRNWNNTLLQFKLDWQTGGIECNENNEDKQKIYSELIKSKKVFDRLKNIRCNWKNIRYERYFKWI